LKLFWKIFFSAMFISTICVTVSGYFLINADFRAQLKSEVKTAQDYGDLVHYSLASELKEVRWTFGETENGSLEGSIARLAQFTSIHNMNQKIAFGVMDETGEPLFSSLPENLEKSMISQLKEVKRGWSLKDTDQGVYIQAIRPVSYLEHVFYVETMRDVTRVFHSRKKQYETLVKSVMIMMVVTGILTFFLSKLLVRKIVDLTKVAKAIAGGDLEKRALSKGRDEIDILSENFNKMAEQLQGKIDQLEEAAERKERFVASFSHELKTPLTSVIGYADLLRQKDLPMDQRICCANYIFSEGKRLENISMRLLDLIVLKKKKIQFQPVSMKRMFEEVAVIVKPQWSEAGVSWECQVEDRVFLMEAGLMKTVFINLMDNARKALEPGGTIKITGTKQEDGYLVRIEDSGVGMEQKELDKIKDAFYMVDGSRVGKQGSVGLGLAICDEILRLHGFGFAFDSRLNAGTTAMITIKGEEYEVR
jgi:signal transduction histidine kinase